MSEVIYDNPEQPEAPAPVKTVKTKRKKSAKAKAAKPAKKAVKAKGKKGAKKGKARATGAARPRKDGYVGGLTAAAMILKDSKTALNVREIFNAAKEKGLWNPPGKTPWATLSTEIRREIARKGKESRFAPGKERGKFELA